MSHVSQKNQRFAADCVQACLTTGLFLIWMFFLFNKAKPQTVKKRKCVNKLQFVCFQFMQVKVQLCVNNEKLHSFLFTRVNSLTLMLTLLNFNVDSAAVYYSV